MKNKKRATRRRIKTYLLNVTLDKEDLMWRASVPGLEDLGVMARGGTKQVALYNLEEAARLVLEGRLERGEALPEDVRVAEDITLAVTL